MADTDSDGLSDLYEVEDTDGYGTDPLDADSDDDTLLDGDEVNVYYTNPVESDTDFDDLSDSDEIFIYYTHPDDEDTDVDGLNDGEEVNIYGTNPLVEDTDGDTLWDGDEVNIFVTDPLVANTVPVPNDDFANAAIIDTLPYSDIAYTNFATTAIDDPTTCISNPGPSVWYTFTPENPASYRLSLWTPNFSGGLAIFQGTELASLSLLDCISTPSNLDVRLEAGQTYYLMVAGAEAATGRASLYMH